MLKPKAEVMKDLARVRPYTIIIQKKTDGFDENRNQIEIWEDWKTLKADRTTLFGNEYYAAKAVNEEQTVVFIVRYVPFLEEINTVQYRLFYRGKPYDIKHIDHPPGAMWVKIKAVERGVQSGKQN